MTKFRYHTGRMDHNSGWGRGGIACGCGEGGNKTHEEVEPQ